MEQSNLILPHILRRDNRIYVSPHNSLKPYIAHYTFTYPAGDELPVRLTLIPDLSGCIVIKFDGNDLECNFFGPTTKTITVENQQEMTPLMLFVEFLPAGAHQLFGYSLSDIADQVIPLEDINHELKLQMADTIFRYIDMNEYIVLLTNAMNRIFLTYLSKSKTAGTISNLITYLYQNKDMNSVRKLSEASQYSERHFNRLFYAATGTSTKRFLKLLRINQTIKLFRDDAISLTALAQLCGYYDQAHFIHDFKSVCEVTPSDFRSNLSEFYNEAFKF